MKQLLYIILGKTLLFLALGCNNSGQNKKTKPIEPVFTKKVNAYIQAHAANGKFNGNVFIAKGDSVMYSRSIGLANRENRTNNSDSTIFLIGSITKPFTAYSILLLEAQGKLSLEDKLSQFFPDFPKADSVSIKQLLTHTSGITNYHAFKDWRKDSKDKNTSPFTTLEKVKTSPYRFSPGERFRYSNTGYILLGLIIEQLSKQSFEDFIQKEILNPLELKNTGVITNEKDVGNLAKGYCTDPRETVLAEYINYRQPYTSGNMYSTTQDLWKFTKAVMNHRLLPREKTEEIFSVSQFYGYGWGIRNFDSTLAYGHHGGMNGFAGSITYIPSEEYFICFLTNDEYTPKSTIAEDLVALIKHKKVQLPKIDKLTKIDKDRIEKITGNYLIKPGDSLKVFMVDEKLYMQETGQMKHELFPLESGEFSTQLLEFNILFSKEQNGKMQTLSFLGKSNLKAPRMP